MDLVLNPHDAKAVEAADFLKRKVGGKAVALSMGPDLKLVPIMRPLYVAEALGIDEDYVLSDRRMAGSDTLATSYALSLGVKRLVEKHVGAIETVAEAIRSSGYSETVRVKATELYRSNLLPNRVYSELPPIRDSIVERFLKGSISSATAQFELDVEKAKLSRFIVLSGIKTTDGETGSVGPQVAEGVSELLGKVLPHSTYVDDFDIDSDANLLTARRMIGYLSQTVEMQLPALITVSSEYRPRGTLASSQVEVRYDNYRGKIYQAFKWTAEDLSADPKRLGLVGSPTIVGSGIDVGKPPVQKTVGKSLVFVRDLGKFEFEGASFGPFVAGDLVNRLPDGLVSKLKAEGAIGLFGFDYLAKELFS
jgi:electron transfer flavoprotein beta subunit